MHLYLGHVTRKPVFGVFDKVRLKPVCSAKVAIKSHGIANIETRDIIYYLGSKQQKRLSDCVDVQVVVRIWHKQVF